MMKFTIAICLIFTHYVCGAPCIVEKDTCVTTFANVNFSNFYSDTRPSAISTTAQTINKTTRIIYNKRFVKKYRKAQRLLTNCLQSNAIDRFFLQQQGNAKQTGKYPRLQQVASGLSFVIYPF